jgi:hypothetical protein
LFRGNTLPFLIFDLACFAALLGALLREVKSGVLPPGFGATVRLVIVLLLATSCIVIDCSVPALGSQIQTAAFFVLALVLLDGAGEEGRYAGARRIGALFAAVAAAFGLANGLMVWPVLLWAAWRGRLPWPWIAAIALTACAFAAAYVPGLPSSSAALSFDPARLLQQADFVVRFLGLPWSHSSSLVWFGRGVGVAVFAAGAFAIVRLGIIDRRPSRLQRIAVGLLLFAFLMAAVAAVGRIDVDPNREMPIRYAIFPSLAHAGLLLAAVPWLSRVWALESRRALQGAILGIAVLSMAQQVVAGRAAVAGTAEYTAQFHAFAAGQWAPEMLHFVYPDRAGAERGLAIVRSKGIYQN